jgi:hypothetical protein
MARILMYMSLHDFRNYQDREIAYGQSVPDEDCIMQILVHASEVSDTKMVTGLMTNPYTGSRQVDMPYVEYTVEWKVKGIGD